MVSRLGFQGKFCALYAILAELQKHSGHISRRPLMHREHPPPFPPHTARAEHAHRAPHAEGMETNSQSCSSLKP